MQHFYNMQTGETEIIETAAPSYPPSVEDWRASATCTKMQGVLALGEERWGQVLAYRETATWSEKVVIDSATDWHRNSQDIQFFAYLLDLSPTEVDDLFRVAAKIER